MSVRSVSAPLAVLFGCSGPALTADERAFFRDTDPTGFILFRRNVESPDQVARLTAQLRDCTGRPDAPILIDQEGGRVARLGPPHWRNAPAAAVFGALAQRDRERARRAAWLNSRLVADDLCSIGISVDCLPVLDLRFPGAHDVIGDRAYGEDAETVAGIGRAACEGLLAGGVLPVVKHIPGHGRATADSHLALPTVTADRRTLEATDFVPFRMLADMPAAMSAHILYTAVDNRRPATVSPVVIGDVIRGSIGFDGLLLSDDISMAALGGAIGRRADSALRAGCDLVLHCNGDLREMREVASAVRALDARGEERLARALHMVQVPVPFDREATRTELDHLLGSAGLRA